MHSSVLLTNLYQLMMVQSYLDHGMQETAAFEFFARKLPARPNFLIDHSKVTRTSLDSYL